MACPRSILTCAVLGILLLLGSCRTATFAGGGTTPAQTNDAAKPGGSRPTDGDEGVGGYLTDPALVHSLAAGAGQEIQGQPGAVASPAGSPAGVPVAAWSATVPPTPTMTSLAATLLTCQAAQADGSFTLEVAATAANLVITVGLSCDGNVIPLQPRAGVGTNVAVPSGGGSFVDLFASASGTSTAVATTTTSGVGTSQGFATSTGTTATTP